MRTKCAVGVGLVGVVSCTASANPPGLPNVQFRIVERTGQGVANASDNVLDLAVQAMCPTHSIGQFTFMMRIEGEPENGGTLARGLIMNADATYATGLGVSSIVGRGGLASQYSYLAGIDARFNGLFNQNAQAFHGLRNTPDQEIINVVGNAMGPALLRTPGLDVDGDGQPDTWSENGTGATPPSNAYLTVPLENTVAAGYLGLGEFVDVYRFRYTVAATGNRTLHFTLVEPSATIGSSLVYNQMHWSIRPDGYGLNATSTVQPLDVQAVFAIPAPGAMFLLGIGCAVASRRRR